MKKKLIKTIIVVTALLLLCGCGKSSISFSEDTLNVISQMNSAEVLQKEYDSYSLKESIDGKDRKVVYGDDGLKGTVQIGNASTTVSVKEGLVEYGLKEDKSYFENILISEYKDMWDLSDYLDFSYFDLKKAQEKDGNIVISLGLKEDKISDYLNDSGLSLSDVKQVERTLSVSAKDYSLVNIEDKITFNDKKDAVTRKVEMTYNIGAEQRIREVIDHQFNSATDDVKVFINENTKYEEVREYAVPKGSEINVELSEDQILDDIKEYEGIITYHITDHSVDGISNDYDIIDPYDSSGFVLLTDYVPDAILEIRYYSTYNFVGNRIDGYEEPIALLTKEAAIRLKEVADELRAQGYRLKIFDAYRPTVAEDYFVNWCHDLDDQRMKAYFYPYLDKSYILAQGYLAERTGHNRGSTLDLTLFDMDTGKEVDMGYPFDYFGVESHPDYTDISEEQYNNRMILREAMTSHNFRPFEGEWWHFIMNDEPYPHTNFSFPVNHKVLKNYN